MLHLEDHVLQAGGMIAAQIDCDLPEALGRLSVVAAAIGQEIDMTALDVIDGILRFDL